MSLLYAHCANNHPSASPVEFCLSDFDVMSHSSERHEYWAGWTPEEFREACVTKGSLLSGHFAHPKYKRVQGRPVFYRGNAESLLYYEERFGVSPDEAVSLIRKGSGENIYLVATNTKPEFYRDLKAWGFDCFTEYLWYSDTWQNVMRMYRDKWALAVEIAKATGLKYWVPTTSGFDSSAWYDHPNRFIPTPEQYEAHIREARDFARRNFLYTDGHVNDYSWNEFGEQVTPIEPTVRNGDVFLRAHRSACA